MSRQSIQASPANYNINVAASSSTTSIITPSLYPLAEPSPRQVDGAAMDYLLMEMVHTLRASSAVAATRMKKIEKEMIDAGLLTPPQAVPASQARREAHAQGSQRDSLRSLASTPASQRETEDEELRIRLENVGIHVGSNIAERYVFMISLINILKCRFAYNSCAICTLD